MLTSPFGPAREHLPKAKQHQHHLPAPSITPILWQPPVQAFQQLFTPPPPQHQALGLCLPSWVCILQYCGLAVLVSSWLGIDVESMVPVLLLASLPLLLQKPLLQGPVTAQWLSKQNYMSRGVPEWIPLVSGWGAPRGTYVCG